MATYPAMQVTQLGQQLYAKVQTGTALQFTRFQIGNGELSTTLSASLTSGTAYTALPVNALTSPVANGDTITIGSGGTTQTVTSSGSAAIGATSIPVSSFTANANYASGTTVTTVTDVTKLTALLAPIDHFAINKLSQSGTSATVTGIYQNTNLSQSTYTCEIGLFAQDPQNGEILYAYSNAGANGDTMPPASNGPYSRQFGITSQVGNASSVTANIPANTYIPQSEAGAANGVATLDGSGAVPAAQLKNVPASNLYTSPQFWGA